MHDHSSRILAGVTDTVAVLVQLLPIPDADAVVAHIANPVAIGVCIACICVHWTHISVVWNAISVHVAVTSISNSVAVGVFLQLVINGPAATTRSARVSHCQSTASVTTESTQT
jgi:hypothetical protein